MPPKPLPAPWLFAALALLVFVGLSWPRKPIPSEGMRTAKAPTNAAATRRRRAERARRRRAEDKADYAIAVKRLAAIEAGQSQVLTREQFLHALDLRD